MHKSNAAVFAMMLTVTAFALPAAAKDAMKGGSAVLIPAGDLKWSDVAGVAGAQTAVLEGNPAKGPHHAMFKFNAGFTVPLHHHSSDHYVSVLSGTMVLTVDGKETKLPAGSFFSFKGKKQHFTRCEAGAECVVSVDSRGKWDVLPEAGKPAAKK